MQFTSFLENGQLTVALTGEIDHHRAKHYIKAIAAKIEEYKGLVQKCRGCRKGECDHRIPVTADGKKQNICNVAWWYFPPEEKAIPYIVAAYRI